MAQRRDPAGRAAASDHEKVRRAPLEKIAFFIKFRSCFRAAAFAAVPESGLLRNQEYSG
jgi:hypothetical protein